MVYSVGSARLTVIPTMSKGFNSSLSSQMATTGKTAGSKFKSGFGTAIKGFIGPLVAVAGVAAVGSFFKGAYGEAVEAQKASKLTAAAIKSTGGVARVTSKDISDLANSLSLKIGVDDEAIQSGENMLLTFTNVRNEVGKGNDIFSRATTTVQDMAAAFGGDSVSNSKLLGKALNDPVKGMSALQRVGVSFTEQQKLTVASMIEGGDTLGAQKLILGELTKETAGAAESQATAGEKLTVAWNNVKEQVGLKLMPVFTNLFTYLAETAIPALVRFGGFFDDKIVPALQGMTAEFKKNVMPTLRDFGDWIQSDVLPVVQQLVDYIKDHWPQISKTIGDVFKAVGGILSTAFAIWHDLFSKETGLITAIWNKWGKGISSFLEKILGDVIDLIRGRFEVIKGIFDTVLALLRGDWKGVWEGMKEILHGAWTSMTATIKLALDVVKGLLRAAWELIKVGAQKAWDGIKWAISEDWKDIKSGIGNAVDGVKSILGTAWDKIKTAAGNAWNGIASTIKTAFNKVKGFVESPIRFVINSVMAPLANKFNDISGFVGGPQIDPIPHYAKGGIFPGYSPGRDIGLAAVSGGEAIMRPEWTRAVGEDAVHAMNKAAREGRLRGIMDGPVKHFADGGIFRPAKGGTPGGLHDAWTGYPATDLGIPTGSQVASVAAGRVSASYDIAGPLASDTYAGDGPYGSYGRVIRVLHQGFESLYAHLSSRGVAVGSGVTGGQVIGLSGNTGNSSDSHLHFGVKGRSPFDFMGASTNYSGSAPGSMGVPAGTAIGSPFGIDLPGWVKNPLGTLKGVVSDAFGGSDLFDSPIGKALKRLPGKLIGGMVDKVQGLVSGLLNSPLTGGGDALNRTIVQAAAAGKGWGTGAEWAALNELIMHESGFDNTAQNPSSTAYGLFQFLDSTWGPYGPKTSDPVKQSQYGLRYIQDRYHDPIGAWDFWRSHNYYDNGGVLRPGRHTVENRTGKPEAVLTAEQWKHIKMLISRTFVGNRPGGITGGFLSDHMGGTPRTPGQLKDRYGDAMATYRKRLEEALRARVRLSAAEDKSKLSGKAVAAAQKELARAEADLSKLRSSKELRDLIKAKKDEKNPKGLANLRTELRQRGRISEKIDKITDQIKGQGRSEKEINRLIRMRTKDYEKLQAHADRAKDDASKAAAAYAAAQKAAIAQARSVSASVTGLGSLSSSPVSSAQGLKRMLRNAIRIGKGWSTVVKRLIRGGLRGPLLDQFIEQGPSQEAISLGGDLLRSGSIKQVLRMQATLQRIGDQAGARTASSPRQRVQVRRGQQLTPSGFGGGDGTRNYNVNFNGNVYAENPDRLAQKIHSRQQQALRVAQGAGS